MTNKKAELHVLTEYCPFAMGFVIITPEDRAIIIDGGTRAEVWNVKEHVGDRPIAAWILTHTDGDHVGALSYLIKKDDDFAKRTECFISNFHTPEFFRARGAERTAVLVETYESFIKDNGIKLMQPVCGDRFEIDGLDFEVMFSKNERYVENFANDASLAFRVTGAKRNVLFLGDLGPNVSEELIATHGENLRSDIVQMAHHGHACVSKAVYELIDPNACIWCAASWLWQELDDHPYLPAEKNMFGVTTTRRWMDEIGHQEHIVTKDGDRIIDI